MNKGIKPLAKTLGWGGVGLGELAGLWKLYHPNHTGGGSQESSEE